MESVITDILLKLLSTQLGTTEEAVAELLYKPSEDGKSLDKTKLNDDVLKTLLEEDKKRVAKLKTTEVDKTAVFDEAYAKAKKEVLSKAEKSIAKKYGVEQGSLKLPELVQTIVDSQVEVAAATGDKVTEDIVKKHPTYLALERARGEEIDSLKTTHETEVKKLQDSYARTETIGDVKANVLSYFDGLNPVLSEDVKKATNQRNRFADSYEKFDYLKDGNDYLMLDSEGKRMEDAHGNPITLKSHVAKEAAQYYDFKVQDDKGGPANTGDGVDGDTVVVPSNDDEYAEAIFNASTVEEREAIEAAFNAKD